MAKLGRFQFSLARVLGVREIERRLAGARVAEANGRLREAVIRRDETARYRDQLVNELQFLRASSRIDITACLSVEILVEGARAAVGRCDEVVAHREAERLSTLAVHAETHKKVEALTRLREARWEAHAQERRVWESKAMDEVAAVRSQARFEVEPTPPSALPSPNLQPKAP